jgi:hypothetical protein
MQAHPIRQWMHHGTLKHADANRNRSITQQKQQQANHNNNNVKKHTDGPLSTCIVGKISSGCPSIAFKKAKKTICAKPALPMSVTFLKPLFLTSCLLASIGLNANSSNASTNPNTLKNLPKDQQKKLWRVDPVTVIQRCASV